MKRLTLTITRYEMPEPGEDTGAELRRGPGRPYRDEMMMGRLPESVPMQNVLTIDVSEAQYEAIKKAALETF